MVFAILAWLFSLAVALGGAGLVLLIIFANAMRPVPGPFDVADKVIIAAGLGLVALGTFFIVLLVLGY